jgi:adsorption protein B
MWWLDIFTVYLYALKAVVVALAIVIFISSMDDLFIDIVYWVRRLCRAFTIYARHKRMDYKTLYNMEEKPLAILIPAWQEHGVIGRMAELAATTLDY